MKIDNLVELKRIHAKDILDYIKENPHCLKKDINNSLNLSFATVSNLCNEMREKGYLLETALDNLRAVGRTPKSMSLNEKNLLCVCYDLTCKGKIRAAVIDYNMDILYDDSFSYNSDNGVWEAVESCRRIYEDKILSQFDSMQIIGIGVAIPGIFEKKSCHVVFSAIEMFNNQPLKDMFEEQFGKTIYIENDSNLCAYFSYKNLGRSAGQNDIIYIFADEGLGIGIVADGKVIRGSQGYASEVCHIPIGNPKLQCCTCSGYGCVESDLRLRGYVEKYNLYRNRKEDKIYSFKDFCLLLEKKQETAVRVHQENAVIMGKLLSIVNNIFNPDIIYIGGKTVDLMEKELERSIAEVKSRLPAEGVAMPGIVLDKDSSTTIIKGAAEILFLQWLPI